MVLPIYEIVLDDNCEGLYTISLVKDPAMLCSWIAFSKEQPQQIKCNINDEERRVLAVVARADFPFYRMIDGFEFYGMFTKETISKMVQKFLKNGFQNSINIEHNPDSYIDGVEVVQMFIKNTEKGINPKGFEQIEEGSLFVEYKIENEDVWTAIKNGVFTSISLEGFFNLKPTEKTYNVINTEEELIEELNKL